MRHEWFDSSGNDRPFRRFRKCANCGIEQEHVANYEWMRVVSYQWWPLVGRCKPQQRADSLRVEAHELEGKAAHLSDWQGGADLERQARKLRKEAQEIEKCLPSAS